MLMGLGMASLNSVYNNSVTSETEVSDRDNRWEDTVCCVREC